jgi:hypothetical protein
MEDNIKMDIQELGYGVWTGSSCLRIGTDGGHCGCGNEPSGSIKCREFLVYLQPVSCSRRTLLHTVSNLFVTKNRLTGSLSVESRGSSSLHN